MDTKTATPHPIARPTTDRNRRLAAALSEIVDQLPAHLVGSSGKFRLLEALCAQDRHDGGDLARRLLLLAAEASECGDERRVAEFLLRNRHRATDLDATLRLIACARCTADLDGRFARWREVPVDPTDLHMMEADSRLTASAGATVADIVLDRLEDVIAERLDRASRYVIAEAVVSFMGLAERHVLNSGSEVALVAMRPAARKPARLVTSLREQIDDDKLARRVARLLIGSDGTPAETGFLWWVVGANRDRVEQRTDLIARWRYDVHVIADRCAKSTQCYAA